MAQTDLLAPGYRSFRSLIHLDFMGHMGHRLRAEQLCNCVNHAERDPEAVAQ